MKEVENHNNKVLFEAENHKDELRNNLRSNRKSTLVIKSTELTEKIDKNLTSVNVINALSNVVNTPN